MLTISKPLSAAQAQTYHAKEFTAKEQNYWSQQGAPVGEWQGHLAEQFGLAGAVSADDFARLSQGQHPQTAEPLVRQRAFYEYADVDGKTIKTMEHRAGWDATFSAPKSVSLTALVGGDDRVREAHRESVRVALEQLEYYTMARIGGNHPPEATAKFRIPQWENAVAADRKLQAILGQTRTVDTSKEMMLRLKKLSRWRNNWAHGGDEEVSLTFRELREQLEFLIAFARAMDAVVSSQIQFGRLS